MALPVIISPMAGQGLVHVSAEAGAAKGAGLAGAVFSAPTMSNVTLEEIAQASQAMRLEEGDLIYTGTPAGVGPVVVGDRITAGIDGLGEIQIEIGERE